MINEIVEALEVPLDVVSVGVHGFVGQSICGFVVTSLDVHEQLLGAFRQKVAILDELSDPFMNAVE